MSLLHREACLLQFCVHLLIFPAYPPKTVPINLTGVMPNFLCLGKRRGTGEGRLQVRLDRDLVMKQRFKIQLSYWMHQFPHYMWQLHDVGTLLCYPVQKRNLEFGVQLKKIQPEDCSPYITSTDQFLLPQPFLQAHGHSWPFIWTS